MLRRKAVLSLVCLFLLLAATAHADLAVCRITGVLYVDGLVSPNTRVTFVLDAPALQVSTNSVVRPSQAMRITDSGGNLPAISLPQGVTLKVIVGKGPSVPITIPNSTTATLSSLLP